MIFLSAAEKGLGSTIGINAWPESDLKTNQARIRRELALDGTTVIVNSGKTSLDSDLTIVGRVTKTQELLLWDLYFDFSSYILVVGASCYEVVIKSLSTNSGNLNMKLYIKERLN